MADTDIKPETPDAFLRGVTATLQGAMGVDADLANILATEILVAKPPADAVNRAKAAIFALAAKRATASEKADG